MRALAIDVGTGTQDILLFDDSREIENCVRLVLPSPTTLVAERIHRATVERRPVVMTGPIMGGGPSQWAARDHAAAGLPMMATAAASETFDDDPDAVEAMGIRIVDADEARRAVAAGAVELRAGDLALDELADVLGRFGVDLGTVDAIAVAVFDHGAAPPGVSDRRFRFDRLREAVAASGMAGPAAFGWLAEDVPGAFTRLAAAADAARQWISGRGSGERAEFDVLVMDTAPAAVLGSLDDETAREALRAGRTVIAANVGNFHALAMRLTARDGGVAIEGIVEHHTGELDRSALRHYLEALAGGTLDGDEVFRTMGHGGLLVDPGRAAERPLVSVTGPRRSLLGPDPIPGLGAPRPAVPHADMMQTGAFGLLRALAHQLARWREPIERRLGAAAPGGTS